MSSRPSRQSRRPVVSRTQRAAMLDVLERRQMLSATTKTTPVSTVLSTMATIKPLKPVSTYAKAVRNAVNAAGAALFTAVADVSKSINGQTQHVDTKSATPFTLDLNNLTSVLSTAPMEYTNLAATAPLVLAIPMPDGSLARFKVVKSEVMDPALAAQFPTIQTYRGIGIDDPTADIRLDTTMLGFHAQVLSTKGDYYIDPYFLNDAKGSYVSFFKKDAFTNAAWSCGVASATGGKVDDTETALEAAEASGQMLTPSITYAGTLRTFRAAVGANHQYVAAVGGGTVAGGQASIVTAMNRVTGVYETELGIRLVLVANNSSIVYASASGDPWTSNTGSIINTSTTTINGVIGSGNYDIGHVFTTGSGGVAFLGVVGKASNKGGGTTGSPSPTGDAFYIDYVAHEMGHQFGANHTFNTSGDSGNRNAGTAYEPGSGISIMAYAGIEGTDDLAAHSIAYFHSASIDEIRTYIGTISGVGTTTATGDNAPTVNAGLDYVIPTGTPFALTATGSDPDGDTLTYDWQERDLGAGTLLSTADNGASPLFTEVNASTSPTRTLPTLNSILGGFVSTVAGGSSAAANNVLGNGSNSTTALLAERMYAVARTASNWRVTARDNRGGLTTDDMVLKVVNTGAAFAITSLNAATTLQGGSTQTLTWNVAGTTANGINAANVNILLSLDGGQTFNTTLAAATANDGSETIQLPYGVGSNQARIKVIPTNNIFFDITNANFTLTNVTQPVPVSATPGLPILSAASDTGVSSSDNITRLNNSVAASVLSFSVSGTVAGATVELLSDGVVVGSAVATGTSTVVTTNGTATLADGTRSFTARQTEPSKTTSSVAGATPVVIDTLAPSAPSAPDLAAASDSGISNTDNITNVTSPSFAISSTDTYSRVVIDGSQTTSDYSTSVSVVATLGEGGHDLSSRSVDAAGNVSAVSPTLHIVIDTTAPTLNAPATFAFETAQTLTYAFSEDVAATLGTGNFTITADNGATVPAYTVSVDPGTHVATIAFASILPDANYSVAFNPSAVTDTAGNAVAAGDTSNFFVLAGDANHDRTVNFDDLIVLAQNYNTTGKTFSQGNFNYSSGGEVNFDDLIILAQKYNTSLSLPAVLAARSSTVSVLGSSKDDTLTPTASVLA